MIELQPFTGNQDNQTLSPWGEMVVTRGRIHLLERLPGFYAIEPDQPQKHVGKIHYHIESGECQIVVLHIHQQRHGAGTALVKAVLDIARSQNLKRIWLTLTNDQLEMLGFFQTLGFDIIALHRNTAEGARKVDVRIPQVGCGNIPVRHEFEMEYLL